MIPTRPNQTRNTTMGCSGILTTPKLISFWCVTMEPPVAMSDPDDDTASALISISCPRRRCCWWGSPVAPGLAESLFMLQGKTMSTVIKGRGQYYCKTTDWRTPLLLESSSHAPCPASRVSDRKLMHDVVGVLALRSSRWMSDKIEPLIVATVWQLSNAHERHTWGGAIVTGSSPRCSSRPIFDQLTIFFLTNPTENSQCTHGVTQ